MIITLKGADFSANYIGTLDTWSIVTTLGGGATYNGVQFVDRDAEFSGTVTLADGYEIGAAGVTVTMGGTPLTNAVTISGNTITISIASVTGTVYISVPTMNTSTGEEDTGTNEPYWIAEKLSGNTIGSGTPTSMLNTQWFVITDETYVNELSGKTVQSMAWASGNKETTGSTIYLYLVNLADTTPSTWELKDTLTGISTGVSAIYTKDLNTPFTVPAGYTIGYRSDKGNVFGGGSVVADYKRTETYYNSGTAGTAQTLGNVASIDFKVVKE